MRLDASNCQRTGKNPGRTTIFASAPAVSWMLISAIGLASAKDAGKETGASLILHPEAAAAEIKRPMISFQTIVKGYRSGINEFLQVAIHRPADWIDLWKKHASVESPPAPLPEIDFSKETVVGVFLGERPTGGHDVEIVRIEKDDAGLSVSFIEKRPPSGGVVTQALTQPFHIVRFAAQGSGNVTFRRLP